jgi:hypothetical protein
MEHFSSWTNQNQEVSQDADPTTITPVNSGSNAGASPHSKSAAESALVSPLLKPINHNPRARGKDFEVQNANPERDKYAAKDKGKAELTGKGALRPNRARVKE